MRSTVALVAGVTLTLAACGGSGQASSSDQAGSAGSAPVSSTATTATASYTTANEAPTGTSSPRASEIDAERYPIAIDAMANAAGDNMWRFDVTLSSPYDTPERYADAWRVLDQADNELGVRVLTHDHATEQPFTRSATFAVPRGTAVVFVEGRDLRNGWSGQRLEVVLETP